MDKVQKKSNLASKQNVLTAVVVVASIIYLVWRIFFTLPFEYGALSLVFGILLLVCEGLGILEMVTNILNRRYELPEMPQIPEHMFPSVDVLIATHNEDAELLYKTINGCRFMKYPDKSKVHIYVCDDNDRPEIYELAKEMGVGYFGLSGNTEAKAGNLNNALRQTSSELVVTFDADMIPTSDFLLETVPYFALPKMKKVDGQWSKRLPEEIDPDFKIGFVQIPQRFYNADLFQYNLYSEKSIPNEQDFFFREVNVGRTKTNSVIYAGSNTVICREALEAVGGIVTGTITEDLATGVKIQEKGYRSLAADKELAHGLSPENFTSLIKQRQRWGRGGVQVMGRPSFWFNSLPAVTKFSYFTSLIYWWTYFRRFVYVITPLLFAFFGIVFLDTTLLQLLLIWLPFMVLSYMGIEVISGRLRSPRLTSIFDTILFPYMVLPIITEALGIKMKKFSVTPKEKKVNFRNTESWHTIPHFIFLGLTVAAAIVCIYAVVAYQAYGALIPLLWLAYNFYMFLMAIIFMLGRINHRTTERLYISVPVEIDTGFSTLNGVTEDVSDRGIAVLLDDPEYVPDDSSFYLILSDNGYTANMEAIIAHIDQVGGKWKYSMQVKPRSFEDKAQYSQILYDRHYALSSAITATAIDELSSIRKGRRKLFTESRRSLPRIPLKLDVHIEEAGHAQIVDYSYKNILVEYAGELPPQMTIILNDGYKMQCRFVAKKGSAYLYEIPGWEKHTKAPEVRRLLEEKMRHER